MCVSFMCVFAYLSTFSHLYYSTIGLNIPQFSLEKLKWELIKAERLAWASINTIQIQLIYKSK